jgi:hypothetical protein
MPPCGALIARTSAAGDLTRLGQAARDRGLYRHAAALWTTAATLGSADAAGLLITHLGQVSPGEATPAARWTASHVSLDDPWADSRLLRALREAGASEAVTALAARAAAQASLDDPYAVARLLGALREAGAGDAVRALLDRDPAAQASLDRPEAVTVLLPALREAGPAEPGPPGSPRSARSVHRTAPG